MVGAHLHDGLVQLRLDLAQDHVVVFQQLRDVAAELPGFRVDDLVLFFDAQGERRLLHAASRWSAGGADRIEEYGLISQRNCCTDRAVRPIIVPGPLSARPAARSPPITTVLVHPRQPRDGVRHPPRRAPPAGRRPASTPAGRGRSTPAVSGSSTGSASIVARRGPAPLALRLLVRRVRVGKFARRRPRTPGARAPSSPAGTPRAAPTAYSARASPAVAPKVSRSSCTVRDSCAARHGAPRTVAHGRSGG